jgi:hypothetical protein
MSTLRDLVEARGAKSILGLSRHRLELNRATKSFGVNSEYHTDFDHFRDVVEAIPGRGAITPVFDPRHCDIDAENGFWIKGTDDGGKVVHVQAFRFDDLTGSTLAEHWQTIPAAFGPAGLPIDLEKSNFHTAPASHEITGRVCYHGEVWIDPKFRNMRIAATLATFAQLLAVTRFMPDYNYGFIPPHLVKRGYPARIGYLHLHPWAPSWHVCGREEPYDDYLVWVTGQELT